MAIREREEVEKRRWGKARAGKERGSDQKQVVRVVLTDAPSTVCFDNAGWQNVSCGVRGLAQLPAVDLKSTPLTTRAN